VSGAVAEAAAGVRIRDLEFAFGDREFVLRIDELDIAPGSRVALVGPSGCGKTTLLHLVAGILTPKRGEVRVGDVPLAERSDRERRDFRIRNIGMVFQSFELIEYLRVLDNILLPYRINSALVLDSAVKERARVLAATLGIGERLHRRIQHLSQGERQRVAICRALLSRPSLVLADEPTGNLDPRTTSRILDVFFEQVEQAGATLVVVTHDHGLLERFDRVVDLADFGGR